MSESITTDHIIAYIDLLGFTASIREPENKVEQNIEQLLRTFFDMRAEFSYVEHERTYETVSYSLKPSISSFSDHIIISYQIDPLVVDPNYYDDHEAIETILHNLRRVVSSVALTALKQGFLIRGAVSMGKLWHSSYGIFGEALIDAYELESNVAIYPRVILSKRFRDIFGEYWKTQFVEDTDGVYYFDYLFDALFFNNPHRDFIKALSDGDDQIMRIIEENIIKFHSPLKMKELAKWQWFQSMYQQSMKKCLSHLEAAKQNA